MIVFHLAIPTHDLDLAEFFYTKIIGAERARRYEDRVTFKFFDHQIVCHLAPNEIAADVKMYPRHFGVTFSDEDAFMAHYRRCKAADWPLWKDIDARWPDLPEAHKMFFVADASNNLLEFKYYRDPSFIY